MNHQRSRLPTGIEGVDEVLGGGLIRGGIYLIMGKPGAGKTIFGNQLAFNVARRGERAAYVTLLAETHSGMTANLERLAFFSPGVIGKSLLYFGGYVALREKGLGGLLDLLRQALRDERPGLLVIDGLMTSRSYAPSDIALKEFVIELQVLGAMHGCTTVLLSNVVAEELNGPEHTMVDGLIELRLESRDERTTRTIEVLKVRGTHHFLGKQEMDITEGGLVVYPNTEEVFRRAARPAVPSADRLSTGVSGLDEMLGGGLREGSVTLVRGGSGTGKTTLCQHFLATGDQGALYCGFSESPPRFLEAADAAGLPLRTLESSGQLRILWQAARRFGLDALTRRLLDALDAGKVNRVVIDGFAGLRDASSLSTERATSYLSALLDELRARAVTTVFTADLVEIAPSDEGLAALADSIIVLEERRIAAQRRRFLWISKQRSTGFDPGIRELFIGSSGLAVAANSASAETFLGGFKNAG